MLIEEIFVIPKHLIEDVVADLFHAWNGKHALLVEARVEPIDGSAGALEAGLGVLEACEGALAMEHCPVGIALGAAPLPENAEESCEQGKGQRCAQCGDSRIAAAE